jgi:hypothetical protein
LADAEERAPKGHSVQSEGDGTSEVRPETDGKMESKKLHRHDRSAEAERFAVNETLDR